MARISRSSESHSLVRLEFEMALEMSAVGSASPETAVRTAAESVGGDLVVLLPDVSGDGVNGIVRLVEDGWIHFVQVRGAGKDFAVSGESDIEPNLLGFARASTEVLERLKRPAIS